MKKRRMSKKVSAKRMRHRSHIRPHFKSDFWLLVLAIVIVGRAMFMEPGTTSAIIADPSLIMHDPLESEATVLANDGMMSGITFVPGHLTKVTYFTSGDKLMYSRAKDADKAAYYTEGSSLVYNTPKGWDSSKGAIEMWIKPDWDPGSDTDKHLFFSAYDKTYPNKRRMELYYDPAYSAFIMKVFMDGKDYRALLGGSANPLNVVQWNHIAASWGPKYGIRVYLNGVEQGFYRTGAGNLWDDLKIDITPSRLIIGNNDQLNNHADAAIDEIMIYNDEKTSFFIS